jgi:hypothetical protein
VIIGCESLGSITVSPGNNVYSDRAMTSFTMLMTERSSPDARTQKYLREPSTSRNLRSTGMQD